MFDKNLIKFLSVIHYLIDDLQLGVKEENNKVTIKASEKDIKILNKIKQCCEEHDENFESDFIMYEILSDVLEKYQGNGGYDFGTADQFGQLSTAYVFVDRSFIDDCGDDYEIYKVFAYDDSYTCSIQQRLIDMCECIFNLIYEKEE